jgi:hypothetical protein
MKCNPSNIRIFNNFVDKEDLKVIDSLCRNSNEQWWHNKCPSLEFTEFTSGSYRRLCESNGDRAKDKHPLLYKYMDKLIDLASYELGRQLVPMFHFSKHETVSGGWCPGHTDSEGISSGSVSYMVDYSPLHWYEPSLIDISANIYVNDDYDGGELVFPEYDIAIKHQAGQLIWFPGGHEFIHGVNKIENGTRWNLITHLTRPKLIVMNNIIHNMYSCLSDKQKSYFPAEWANGSWHPGSGIEGQEDGRYGEGYDQ